MAVGVNRPCIPKRTIVQVVADPKRDGTLYALTSDGRLWMGWTNRQNFIPGRGKVPFLWIEANVDAIEDAPHRGEDVENG